jgi:hypothetical protein
VKNFVHASTELTTNGTQTRRINYLPVQLVEGRAITQSGALIVVAFSQLE